MARKKAKTAGRKATGAKRTRLNLGEVVREWEKARGNFEEKVSVAARELGTSEERYIRALKQAQGYLWWQNNAPATTRGRSSKLDGLTNEAILNALEKNGSVAGAAKALGVASISLNNQLERRRIERVWRVRA